MALTLSEILKGARERVREVGPAEAARLLAEDEGLLLLDVRESEELAGGRLPGALHVPRGVLEPKAASDSPARLPELSDPSRPILVYCATGVRSALAADVLQSLGFGDVRSLAGGFAAWQSEGHPVET